MVGSDAQHDAGEFGALRVAEIRRQLDRGAAENGLEAADCRDIGRAPFGRRRKVVCWRAAAPYSDILVGFPNGTDRLIPILRLTDRRLPNRGER